MDNVALADLPGRPCPIAAALGLVGERWALLVVREIALGATRFGDIVAGTGAPRDRIAARLKALESAGVVARTPYQTGRSATNTGSPTPAPHSCRFSTLSSNGDGITPSRPTTPIDNADTDR